MELRERPARERLEYPKYLANEHALMLAATPSLATRPLESIYFGGGTPSVLSPNGVVELIAAIRARHAMGTEIEVTLEANPENLTPGRCDAWRAAGINRLSIGVQSFVERDLQRLERLHHAPTIHRAVENARVARFENISIDLMFGLPGQTLDEWKYNLQQAVALRPQHLSFYGLTIHEHTPFQTDFDAGRLKLPDEDTQAEMYLWGTEYLQREGFEHYEISNFAREDFRSVHNQRYWRGDDVIGFGPGAHSSHGKWRWQNAENLDAWRAAVRDGKLPRTVPEELSFDAWKDELLFRRLRTREGFSRDEQTPETRLFFKWLDSPSGNRAAQEGWIEESNGRARFTAEGWLRSDGLLLAMVDYG